MVGVQSPRRGGRVRDRIALDGWPAASVSQIPSARRYAASLEPYASGVYVNALSDDGQGGVRRAYSAPTLARLTALKDRYDPGNVFHRNHNIQPSTMPNPPNRSGGR